MKKLAISTLLLAGITVSSNAFAFWNDNDYNKCWGNTHHCNPYDPWDPRYWMEEMEDAFDDDDKYGYGYPPPYYGYGYAPGYQHQPAPNGQMPYMPYPPYHAPYAAPRAPWVRPAPQPKAKAYPPKTQNVPKNSASKAEPAK